MFRKSTCLVKEFFLVNPFIEVFFEEYYDKFQSADSHDHIWRGSLKIQSRSLRLYYRTDRSSPYNFLFASLVSKPKHICIKKSKKQISAVQFLRGS